MAVYNKFNQFVADIIQKIHNLSVSSDQLVVALTNTLPTSANAVLTDITEISYGGLSSRNLTISSSGQVSGTLTVKLSNLVLTGSGAGAGPFRYIVIYNSTPTNKNLICWFDYGSALTLNSGDTLTLTFDATNGLLQIA